VSGGCGSGLVCVLKSLLFVLCVCVCLWVVAVWRGARCIFSVFVMWFLLRCGGGG
jgi:hypothetical protein